MVYIKDQNSPTQRPFWSVEDGERESSRSPSSLQISVEGHSQSLRRRYFHAPTIRRRGQKEIRGESPRLIGGWYSEAIGGCNWGLFVHIYYDYPSQSYTFRCFWYKPPNLHIIAFINVICCFFDIMLRTPGVCFIASKTCFPSLKAYDSDWCGTLQTHVSWWQF